MDDQQRARELLAQEYERDGITHVPDCIRREAMLTEIEHRAVRAITAALRAAPDGFVLVPVEPTARPLEEWHDDTTNGGGDSVWFTWDAERGEWLGEPAWIGRPNDSDWPGYHTHWLPHPAFPAMLAARPQGVKDV
ncbi:hypothetical protein [Stenotrophomonas sp.]|uniref:hypothetical protein n=1 Tax=Stenotrophomonas sp. TaxID=69392 RepID=UPI0028B12BD0|nr:hypothetical protein [Stenotrophomonas sp.]